MTRLKLAVIPGDGIGREVVPEALRALEAALAGSGTHIDTTDFDLGAHRYHSTGEILTDEDLARIDDSDAIVLGAVGDPSVPSGVLERGLLLKLRFSLDHYVNLRPSLYYPGVATPLADPGTVDFTVVREGTEGLYCGNGGAIRTGTDQEIATEVSVNTAFGVQRVVKYAFEQAAVRPVHHLTLVHKHNVLVNAGGLWQRTVEEIGAHYPNVTVDYAHIDAATIYMVNDPGRFDVIVTDNLFGDILTDLAGAVTGGIGLAASGNINPEGAHPSMFEPVHGSGPDIAGTGKADPTAAIASVGMLLEHLGYREEAGAVHDAIERDMQRRADAQASGEQLVRSTEQIGSDIAAQLARD
ncbi:3-isopropylmalate dehydrogenase [Schaalia radingae]|uniref:3-isopropylmalate dehydrogenase n=1 Tax=Schaalia radingae TaxID=131110 RepID=A0ABY0V688_9ACTO|nr:3-isopropylmalate dehydrogenase [Schaalia radingae]SDT88488.1 3-isopropylmalate dehydrogenase [Schaalia radingae]